MTFNYALTIDDYTWKNAILWGNFSGHCQKAMEGNLGHRIVHVLIAALELLPIIGQIASIFEKIIVNSFSNSVEPSNITPTNVTQNVTPILPEGQSLLGGPIDNNAERNGTNPNSNQEQNPSIIKIQSYFRMSLAQRKAEENKRNLLDPALFEKAKPYMHDSNKLDELHRTCGRTPVYLHDEFVIKHCGLNTQERFKKMNQAREIVYNNKYTCLEIPKACTYNGEFLVENRLPIMKGIDMKVQIGFYLDHIDQFNTAVEEFTGFLCQSSLDDIVGNRTDGYASLCQNIGRYENVAMYLEEKDGVFHGKIGLIDLEEFKPTPRNVFSACKDAVCLFPHHLETIINTAKKFDSNIEYWRKDLEGLKNEQLEFFKVAYQDHLDFVKEKNFDLSDPFKSVEISNERQEQIKGIIEQIMHKENENKIGIYENFLGKNVDETVKLFKETSLPKILNKILNFINKPLKEICYQENFLICYKPKDPSEIISYSHLVSTRTLEYSRSEFTYLSLKDSIQEDLSNLAFANKYRKSDFAVMIIDTVFKELEKGKEIAYFNPNFGIGSYEYSNFCIFC